MYNFEDLNVQINQNEQLTIEDKKFLALYHKAMIRPDLLLEDEKSVLSSAISQKMNDTAFNIRVTKFEETLKQNSSNINNEFPYLDILKIYTSPIIDLDTLNKIRNGEALTDNELSAIQKSKDKLKEFPRCIEIYNKEKKLNLGPEGSSLSSGDEVYRIIGSFDIDLYRFEQNSTNQAIKTSNTLSQEDKEFLLLYNKVMNRTDKICQAEKQKLSSLLDKKLNDKAFSDRLTLFAEEIKDKVDFPYLDLLQIYISPIPNINIVNLIVQKAQNKEILNNSEIAILKKVKEKLASLLRCINIFHKDKGLNLNLDRQTSSLVETLKPIDPGLYKVNQTINSSKVLSNDYKNFLLLYNQAMNGTVEMSDTDKKRLSSELELKLKDKKFNEILVQFEREMRGPQEKLEKELSKVKEKYDKDPTESYKLEIERLEKEIEQIRCDFGYFDVIKGYSHEIRNLDYIDSVIKKAQRAKEIIAQNGSLEENEKLSLNELGVLQKANKLKRFIDIFEQKGIHDALTQTDHCKKIKEQYAKVQPLEKHIKNLFDTTVKRFQSGDVLVTAMDKSSAYRGKKPSIVSAVKGALEGKYQDLMDIPKKQFTKYGHAAQLTQVGTEIKQSHMWAAILIMA